MSLIHIALTPLAQASALGSALLLGLALGLLYDSIRPFRIHAAPWKEGLLDLLYCLLVILVIFLSAPTLGNGHIRLFMLATQLLGAVLYFTIFSRLVRSFSTWLARICHRVFSLLLRPFRYLEKTVVAPLEKILDRCRKFIKNTFSFLAEWFTIKWTAKKARSLTKQASDNEEVKHEQKKSGWSSS